jgi:hypothetical protein
VFLAEEICHCRSGSAAELRHERSTLLKYGGTSTPCRLLQFLAGNSGCGRCAQGNKCPTTMERQALSCDAILEQSLYMQDPELPSWIGGTFQHLHHRARWIHCFRLDHIDRYGHRY